MFNKIDLKNIFSYLFFFMTIPAQSFAVNECPQKITTATAPQIFITMQNPLSLNQETLKAGEDLFQNLAKPITCKTCHGAKGDGKSEEGFESTPSARNFTCNITMQKRKDGQLFWVIKNGSKNTSMFSFSELSDNQIWQLIHYIRQFAKK
jgi:mono/diheme cytochrome c family protein